MPVAVGWQSRCANVRASQQDWAVTAQEEPTEPILGLTQVACERIVAELAPGAGNRILRCLRTAESLLGAAGDAPPSLRLAASAVYNLREALDAVVADRPAGEGGFSAAIDAWDRYTTACALAGADEAAARADLAATMDELARTRNHQAFMTRRLLDWFREQTGVDPIPGDTDPVVVYQDLRDQTSRVVHDECPLAVAQSLFAETVAWFERFFTPPSEIVPRIEELAAQPYTPGRLAELRTLATSSHHVRLFLERLQDPGWLEPLRDAELITLPEPQSPWPVAALTGPNRQLPDERVVELLDQLLSDVQALAKAADRHGCSRSCATRGGSDQPDVAWWRPFCGSTRPKSGRRCWRCRRHATSTTRIHSTLP